MKIWRNMVSKAKIGGEKPELSLVKKEGFPPAKLKTLSVGTVRRYTNLQAKVLQIQARASNLKDDEAGQFADFYEALNAATDEYQAFVVGLVVAVPDEYWIEGAPEGISLQHPEAFEWLKNEAWGALNEQIRNVVQGNREAAKN